MEIDDADRSELLRFETVQTKREDGANDIEFDKIKISDVSDKAFCVNKV
jgi:hypothetical protein